MKNFLLITNLSKRTSNNYVDSYTFVVDCNNLEVVFECYTTFRGAVFALEKYLKIEESHENLNNLGIKFLEIQRIVKYRKLENFHVF